MKYASDNERFSAYVDGELTPAERAEVEKQLAQDPAARRLVEELRAVSRALQGLPVHRLNEDLRGAVLTAAERQVLAGASRPGGRPRHERVWRTVVRRVLQPRAMVWPLVAAAAALLISVMHTSGDRREPQQARGTGHAEGQANPAAGRTEDAKKAPAPAEIRPAPKAAPQPPETKVASPSPAPTAMAKAGNLAAPPQSPPAPAIVAATPEKGPAAPEKKATDQPAGFKSPALAEADRPDKLMIVRCDVSQDAAQQRAFEQVLARQKLTLLRQSNDPRGALAGLDRLQGSVILVSRSTARPTVSGTVPVYLQFEGAPAQIEAVLEEFKARPEQFPSCSARFVQLSPIPAKAEPAASESKPAHVPPKPRVTSDTRSVLFVVYIVPKGAPPNAPAK